MVAPHLCELFLLGRFEVRVDGRRVPADAWRRRRSAQLVKMLALADRHRLHRGQILEVMWPHHDPSTAGAYLRKAVHFARRALGSASSIHTSPELVRLFPDGQVIVDVDRFRAAAAQAFASSRKSDAVHAASLYEGQLLPDDRYEAWTLEDRDQTERLAIRVFKVADRWGDVLRLDPADEEAHRALMQQALEAGDRTRAVRQFELLRERLRVDLGMSPDQDSVALYESALASDGDVLSVSERARRSLAWGSVHLNLGDLDRTEELAHEARRLALDNDLSEELGQASALLSIVANVRGKWRDLFRSEFADAVRRSDEMAAHTFDAHLCVSEFHLQGPLGHVGIVAYASDLRSLATASGSTHGVAVAEMLIGESLLFSGELEASDLHLRTAVDLFKRAGAVPGHVVSLQRLAELEVVNGNRTAARRLLRSGLDLAETSSMAPHLVVRMHEGLVAASEGAAALVAVKAGEEELAGTVVCPPCSVGFSLASAATFGRAGEVGLAEQRLSTTQPVVKMWPDGPWHAAVLEVRGVIERARGNGEEAATLFKGAYEKFDRMGRPRDAQRCSEAVQAT